MKTRISCRAKLEKPQPRQVEDTPKGKMLIAHPLDVDAALCRIEPGKLATTEELRRSLAASFGADYTCPLTTGIFSHMTAEAAEEDLARGIEEITPYWRLVRPDGSLNEKFPGGVEHQATRLREEGHTIEAGRGSTLRVKDFRAFLQEM